jgi:transposase-like protein
MMEEHIMIQDSLFKNAPTSPRSLEEKKQCVQSYLNSKLTAKEWCRRNGVSYHTLKNWLYKQRPNWEQHNSVGSSSAAETASRWTRLQIQSSEETSLTIIPAVPAEIRIEFGNIRIFVNSATPTDLLRMVLSEVTSQ